MTSATLPTVDLTAGANSSGSNSGVGRAMKKVNLVSASSEKEQNVFMEEDFTLTKGDVLTKMVEGVPSITFLDRVQEYIERQMAKTIIPWSLDFSTSRSGIESQVIWIRLLELPKGYYSNCLLRVIDKTIGQVVKLDVHTDCARMGRFALLAVWVNLRKLLISKCGLYGHGADLGSRVKTTSPTADFDCASPVMEKSGLEWRVEKEPFGLCMVVEQRKERSRVTRNESNDSYGGAFGGSWFATLEDLRGENLSDVDGKIEDKMEDRN
ncbi:hypothetical protein Gohar_011162 [Gossypium harknessii]|uniref:DUF4283 domain-containing protein n=1 Tax=Gossypium harknessii TaxID=34285 RepID=A0A7J9GVE2_9ROSI|nr:hypothetical protein [Gossypium harknessii]